MAAPLSTANPKGAIVSKPTIVVVNGTADEGFWAVYYLLRTGRFRVRATVRRATGEAVRRLQALRVGAEACEIVVAANEDESALRAAFRGATGIYGTTLYNIHARRYQDDNPEEMAQGRALIAAAAATPTLGQFVFQTMVQFRTPSEQLGLDSPIHFRTKWQLEQMIEAAGLPWTLLRQPAYMRQLRFGISRARRIVFPYPADQPLAFVAEEDIGKAVAQVFLEGRAFARQTIKVVSELVTPVEIAVRAHACLPVFHPRYRRASRLEQAFFDQVIVRLKPAYRYASQINANLAAGNAMDVSRADLDFLADLIHPLKLTRLESWLGSEYAPVRGARPGLPWRQPVGVASADGAPPSASSRSRVA
jgi:uncharacterized protein YbjT (DUF2867 family)